MMRCGNKSWLSKKPGESFDAFEFWKWRRILRIQWTAKKAKKWFIKERNQDSNYPSFHALERALKLQCKERGTYSITAANWGHPE